MIMSYQNVQNLVKNGDKIFEQKKKKKNIKE